MNQSRQVFLCTLTLAVAILAGLMFHAYGETLPEEVSRIEHELQNLTSAQRERNTKMDSLELQIQELARNNAATEATVQSLESKLQETAQKSAAIQAEMESIEHGLHDLNKNSTATQAKLESLEQRMQELNRKNSVAETAVSQPTSPKVLKSDVIEASPGQELFVSVWIPHQARIVSMKSLLSGDGKAFSNAENILDMSRDCKWLSGPSRQTLSANTDELGRRYVNGDRSVGECFAQLEVVIQ
jgi:cell division protein FtsL